MSAVSQELIEIVDKLPEEKAKEVVNFARFLQQQASDMAWESIIGDKRFRPKLDAFVGDALREEPVEPLDPDKL
ncbi:MAG: DUF2281 domain-containing protein [Verrucomicrobiota bacterium]